MCVFPCQKTKLLKCIIDKCVFPYKKREVLGNTIVKGYADFRKTPLL